MPKPSPAKEALPASLRDILRQLGQNIRIARKRRRMSLRELAERALLTIPTVQRVELHPEKVGLTVLAQILFVLNLADGLKGIADPGLDSIGQSMEINRLPKHSQQPKRRDLDF